MQIKLIIFREFFGANLVLNTHDTQTKVTEAASCSLNITLNQLCDVTLAVLLLSVITASKTIIINYISVFNICF